MIAWLEGFRTTEDADDYGNLHLGVCFADLLEFDGSY